MQGDFRATTAGQGSNDLDPGLDLNIGWDAPAPAVAPEPAVGRWLRHRAWRWSHYYPDGDTEGAEPALCGWWRDRPMTAAWQPYRCKSCLAILRVRSRVLNTLPAHTPDAIARLGGTGGGENFNEGREADE